MMMLLIPILWGYYFFDLVLKFEYFGSVRWQGVVYSASTNYMRT